MGHPLETFDWSSRTEISVFLSPKCSVKSRKVGAYASCELKTDEVTFIPQKVENILIRKFEYFYSATFQK